MKRNIFSDEHNILRDGMRKFIEKEITPYHSQWEEDGKVPREIYLKAGEQGFLCPTVSEKYGGMGVDFLYSVVIIEELARNRAQGFMANLHSDVVVPYIDTFGNEEQKQRWLPGCVSGEIITAVAMTEPDTGSDLAAIKTTAVKDGDHYIINGAKTFISNGLLCDLVIVAAKTNTKADPPYSGISLLVVEDGTPGFEKGKKIPKMGLKAQDTAELFFTDCRIPAANLLGKENQGFIYLMQKLQQERLVVAVGAQAAAHQVLQETIQYCKDRKAFGRPIIKFQHTQFSLVEMATEIEMSQTFLDRIITEHVAGKNVITETCMAKYSITEMLKRVCDQCLQFYGGYGYSTEYNIAKDYLDARVQTIYAGTTEIMKLVIARNLGF